MKPAPYPEDWPTADPARPTALHSRITEQQKCDLYARRITTRQLAATLGVHEKYLSARFPGKVPPIDTRALPKARREYRLEIARQVLLGTYNIRTAASHAHCSYNTMQRYVTKAKALNPELAEKYPELVQERRINGR